MASGEGGRQVGATECRIAGAEGQLWPCRWAWLLAFQLDSDVDAPGSFLFLGREHHPARPELVPSGGVRHGDRAVAGECFSRGAGNAEPLALGGAPSVPWARGVAGVGIRCNV
ncbi:MAG: hypothetical protein WAN22_33375 [Solirubrobacteraceae bacterium]